MLLLLTPLIFKKVVDVIAHVGHRKVNFDIFRYKVR